ncbi:MAG: leucine-rich repeat protein [Ruminococcus sp.]
MKNYDYDSNQSPVYNNSDVKKIVIEDGVTSIGDYAFRGCSSLTSITLPDSVTSIGDCAFVFCVGLSSITLPDSVTSIGDSAFKNCSSLTSITIPDRVTSIEPYAFDNCSSLTSITIPNSVTSIGASAFYNCRSLTSITIPDRVTSIESRAFTGCSSLTSITIPDSVTSIGYATFTGCSSLTSITIPDSVTSIGYATFAGCSSLTSITIPDSVTSIGESAFSNCSSLQTISLSCKSTLKRSDFGDQADLVSYALHTLKKTEAKAATYTENGNKAYWTCEHCGKYFLSDDSNSETAKAIELSETVIPALVQIATTTTPIKCVYGQDMNKIDMRDYVKNTDVVGEVTVKVATGSTLPDGMKLDGSKLSGKPAKAYEDGKEVTFTFTAENGSTANLTLLFLVAKADPTVEVAVSGDSHTEGDLVSELKLILSENSTKGVVELVSEIKALVAGKNTLTWKFTPEDENNYNMVTGTVVVNAQTTTTTTTTTKATTTTTKATTTTKPNKMTTTNVTTTMKSSKTTTTKATTTTKPSKTTTTNATTTTKPNKTTTTKVTTTTKPNKTTTTKATTTTTTTISSYGDVNLDGKVDIVDAIFLNKYLATLIQFSDAQVANADCYQDGVLNDQDTTALMQFIILLIDDLPVQPTEK